MLLGEQGSAAYRAAELLLCLEPNRPMQFSINAPIPISISQLLSRASAEIIGKKAGRIVLGLGLQDLRRERAGAAEVGEQYKALVTEILRKTLVPLNILTIPLDLLPEMPSELRSLNETIRSFEALDPKRVKIYDLAAATEVFKEKQMERGKFARSLYTEEAKPTPLCTTFLGLFLQSSILKSMKEYKGD